MRLSPQRHTLAVLRVLIGLTQKELADMVGRSVVTIQKIELGKLRLGPELAKEISGQTWVSLKWLLDGDVSKPPVHAHGGPYTKEMFELRQVTLQGNAELLENPSVWIKFVISSQVRDFAAVAGAAVKGNNFQLFSYRFRKAMDALKKDFGCDSSIESLEAVSEKATDEQKLLLDAALAVEKLFRVVDARCAKPVLASRQSSRARRRQPASR
jgi:transcriptional regulator with XRE-family HTH domain